MNMFTLLYFVTSKQPKNKGWPTAKFNKISRQHRTSGMHLSRCAYVPLFLQTVKKHLVLRIYFSSTRPLLVPSIPEKHYQVLVFRIYKTVWFEHANTFQNYLAKKVTHTIQNESSTIYLYSRFSTLTGRKYCPPFPVFSPWPQIKNLK